MNDSFGPWATAMDSSSVMTLSAFWKNRMGRLTAIAQHPARHSWRNVALLIGLLVATCLLPTFRGAVAQQDTTEEARDGQNLGRIYINGTLRVAGDDGESETIRGIFSINPATGEWKQLLDYGYSPRVSPDGQTLIFGHEDQIWNCDTKEAAGPGRIVDLNGKKSWTPDGKHFIVSSGKYIEEDGQEEGWKVETVKVSADGLIRNSLPIPDTDFVEDCSPNGDWVVTSTDRHPPKGRGYQLYVMRLDGSEQRRITESGLNVYARFSPDGEKIAYVHQKNGNSLRVVDFDGSNERILSSEQGYSNSCGGPSWSPDGKQLAVLKYDWGTNPETGRRQISDPADANYRLEIMDADSGDSRVLELKDVEQVIWLGHPDWR